MSAWFSDRRSHAYERLGLLLLFLSYAEARGHKHRYPRFKQGARFTSDHNSQESQCNPSSCSSLVKYPVLGTHHYAEFNVPALPKKLGPTYFVYYNIDWQPPGPSGSDARMNQFVPQLMLGEPLDGSSGPPLYLPKWEKRTSWCFGAQYFFEIFNSTSNETDAHAATGETYPCEPGEVLYTKYTLSENWVWTLEMGVKGDPDRTSIIRIEKPFMGLLPLEQTQSWKEHSYSEAIANTCWEIYDLNEADEYPGTDMEYHITIATDFPGSFAWQDWGTEQPECPGHPNVTIKSNSTAKEQQITWALRAHHDHKRDG